MCTLSLKLAAGTAAIAVLALVIGAACGGGGGEGSPTANASPQPTLTPQSSPSATLTADQYNRLLDEDRAKPRFEGELGGIRLWSAKKWHAEGRSLCTSNAPEAPYLGPVVFSLRDEDLPALTFPEGYELLDIRMCKDGITAVGYIFGDAFVVLADGPREWPVNAPAERVSAGTIAGRPAVFVAPVVPGQSDDAAVIVAEEFGLTVVSRMNSLDEARRIAEGINREDIHIPQGKDTFTGTLNGIRFYNDLHGDNRKDGCLWGNYGIEDPEADGVEIPPGTPLDIFPSYLPEGYSLAEKHGTTCGGTIDLVEAYFSRKPGDDGFSVRRFSGEAAWFSPYSEDWLTPGTIAGRPAVFITAPAWVGETDASIEVVVKEDSGLTVVTGHIPLEEAKRIAEGLNR